MPNLMSYQDVRRITSDLANTKAGAYKGIRIIDLKARMFKVKRYFFLGDRKISGMRACQIIFDTEISEALTLFRNRVFD